ncbi:transcription initiation factor TFIID complex subunit [Multifurca ochricompacta]|uniref:TBP-associated factor 6 n=1 Tax=Multifurca ochricompacta TaxID=376703 RepID=A0AAD4LX48_9AGAM|nr:transcription initiation factor TFIID complex subunit [Multifurca ochricompacta]
MSTKQKTTKASGSSTGLYKADSVKDVAESLGITNLPEAVASALASDVEYRVHQVIEEASRFMRHARRNTLTTSDIDRALRVLNIEPLYGHSAYTTAVFRRALPYPQLASAGPVYFVEDEEIDFERVLREEKLVLPPSVRWTAHWLAVEGVQPLIPENPPAVPRDDPSLTAPGTSASDKRASQQAALVKQVLSRELQLYYARLTTSILPSGSGTVDPTKRTAALASLRHDAGLQPLLPYLVRWVGEGTVNVLHNGTQDDASGRTLEVLLDVIAALLENTTLFIEPYLHQILPPVLSVLLHSSLPPMHSTHLRTSAASALARILTQYSATYPSLAPRIMKTLLLALLAPDRGPGTRLGALRGLIGVGKEAVRKGILDAGGAKALGAEPGVAGAVFEALAVLHPPSEHPVPLDLEDLDDAQIAERLREILGDFFADRLVSDANWARGVLEES